MIATPSLSEPSSNLAFLKHQQERIHAPNVKVAASMTMKRYAQLLLPWVLDPMILEEKAYSIPTHACTLTTELTLTVETASITETTTRQEAWKSLFADHLTFVLHALHRTTNVPKHILWENIAVRLNSYFRKALEQYPSSRERIFELAKELRGLHPDIFHENKHPIQSYLAPITDLSEQHKRKTCCYFYKLEKEKEMPYCLVCPLKDVGH
ncbi:hypothetical protein J416_15552 [Gracilibacillus halophilus YIM-C55.5]|uniref:Aerobactin siderophore biosynthesis IucA/IucC-like C-terminal domain-containing protein n=1 Tax=Gracilibacillus halophilus YIM-C55.5 TaxID=1308866 RepID=N4WQR7_9BACI|nr:IucA/IucC family C-terminal-domain containing protein [Gracilibacillus halophilus]ENH95546.1 hypothetical protein J416_15552 [Gracilibacillus halophilus YIM-C55.5]